jgi:hypothetical protein
MQFKNVLATCNPTDVLRTTQTWYGSTGNYSNTLTRIFGVKRPIKHALTHLMVLPSARPQTRYTPYYPKNVLSITQVQAMLQEEAD